MTYTKQQRHEFYKKAKEIYIKNSCSVLCGCLYNAINFSNSINSIPFVFPEFKKFEPQVLINEDGRMGLWWKVDDRGSRIACLDACIKQTK